MRKFRFLMCGLLGSAMLAPAASASIAFQNVQVYRWGYVDHDGTRMADLSYWEGPNYDSSLTGGTDPHGYVLSQTGSSTVDSLSLQGYLWNKASSEVATYHDEGMNSVSTRFTLNEKLWVTLNGKIQAAVINLNHGADRMVGTNWTRARIIDAVTGATAYSRIARADVLSTGGDDFQHDIRSLVNNTILLYPGRYNLIVDSFYDFNGSVNDYLSGVPDAFVGWHPVEHSPYAAWNLDITLRRPPEYIVPEPAAGLTMVVLTATLARVRRRTS